MHENENFIYCDFWHHGTVTHENTTVCYLGIMFAMKFINVNSDSKFLCYLSVQIKHKTPNQEWLVLYIMKHFIP